MPSVRKRVQGTKTTWLVDYFDQEGKRHNKTFATQKDAKDWRDRTAVEIKDGVHTPEASSITVAEAGELWLAQSKTDGLEYGTSSNTSSTSGCTSRRSSAASSSPTWHRPTSSDCVTT